MIDVFSVINGAAVISLTGLCYKMANDKSNKYRTTETCQLLHKENDLKVDTAKLLLEEKLITQKAEIIAIKENLLEIKNDVKEILKNGKK
jgi:hypothetical protein